MGTDVDPTDSSDSTDGYRFERIDWETNATHSGLPTPSKRSVGFLLTASATAGIAGYDLVGRADGGPIAFGWYPDPIDWLFLLSLLVFGWYVVVPLAAAPRRTLRHLKQLRAEPMVLASVAYLLVFFLAGTIGAAIVGAPHSDLTRSMQPPAFFTASEFVTGQCVGPVEGGRCHGTFQYPLGTGSHGKDMIHVLVAGARVSLQVALIVGALVAPIAIAVGTVAGYVGGLVDDALMRYVEIQQAIPPFIAYVVLVYVFGPSLHLFVLVFGLLGWGGAARVIRGEVLQCKQEEFVRAAKSQGGGSVHLLRRHILPNVSGTSVTATTQQIPAVLLAEAAVAFLRLNDGATPSWGEAILLGFGQQYKFTDAWWLTTLPVAFLAATIVSIAILGDWLGDAGRPRFDR